MGRFWESLPADAILENSWLSNSCEQRTIRLGSRVLMGKIRGGDSKFSEALCVKGAREHNLKNLDITLPRHQLTVITGVSGSGKSSLAFDTIYAEGQRRYVESLSSYARQFLGMLEKPAFDTISGLSPTIAIEQKSAGKNPRSTVGTITEIYDYLRVLFARLGVQHCLDCGKKVGSGHVSEMVRAVMSREEGARIVILAPLVENRKGEHRELLEYLRGQGLSRVRVNGVIQDLEEVQSLAKNKKHHIDAVIDRLIVKHSASFRKRLTDSIEQALALSHGQVLIHESGKRDELMSEKRSCCGLAYRELEPSLFSFNSPLGMCETCNGLGNIIAMDPDKLVPDKTLSIYEGAVAPWRSFFQGQDDKSSWGRRRIAAMEKHWGLDIHKPWNKLPRKLKDWILHGPPEGKDELEVKWNTEKGKGSWNSKEEGLLARMMRRYQQTSSELMKKKYVEYLSEVPCQACQGRRLKPELLKVLIRRHSIMDVCGLTIGEAFRFMDGLSLNNREQLIAGELIKEIRTRLSFLLNVGLDYLSLDRYGPSLSGGESQRIRLASQVGSELTGVLYVLDEPSIGLHQRDNAKLIDTLFHLRDLGNTLLVVEHDRDMMERADWIVDMGPGAGRLGGECVASGTPDAIRKNPQSLTGQYLSGAREIALPASRRTPEADARLTIHGAREHNLKEITVSFPLGLLNCITGVSGAGKSTLIGQILCPFLANTLMGAHEKVGACDKISGYEAIDKVIHVTQQPIGRTPRSNPATYTKVFDLIRDFFAMLPESRMLGYKKGRFSFNVKGGRCEACCGDGYVKVEMHFLSDVFVPCESCKGLRFNEQTLEVRYKNLSIADVLNLSVRQAIEVFANNSAIVRILQTLMDVGLDYIHLGQSATTLSGGEAQRIRLARELAKRDTGRTFYVLDEPTTGLHFEDISRLLQVLQSLVDRGNTVLLIEHNLDVIRTADWIIDLGPEGGHRGGEVIAEGTPEQVARCTKSFTGQYLRDCLPGLPVS